MAEGKVERSKFASILWHISRFITKCNQEWPQTQRQYVFSLALWALPWGICSVTLSDSGLTSPVSFQMLPGNFISENKGVITGQSQEKTQEGGIQKCGSGEDCIWVEWNRIGTIRTTSIGHKSREELEGAPTLQMRLHSQLAILSGKDWMAWHPEYAHLVYNQNWTKDQSPHTPISSSLWQT